MRIWSFRASMVTALSTAFVAVLFVACQKDLPSAPSDLATGITIYEHANFQGRSAHITADIDNFEDYNGPCEHTSTETVGSGGGTYTSYHYNWGDCVSSVKVAPGWRATIYRDDSFKGQSFEVTVDVPDLTNVPGSCSKGGLNDCISSVRVSAK